MATSELMRVGVASISSEKSRIKTRGLGKIIHKTSSQQDETSEMPKSFVIEQSYHFKAPQARVFKALTDPKLLEKWFLSKAKLVPKKGGSYSFNWIGSYHMTGNVKQFEPDKAVSFSWTDKSRTAN